MQISSTVLTAKVAYEHHHIQVFLPVELASNWMGSEQVSIRSTQQNGQEHGLQLLIEKDFRCLTERPGEDEEDLFPHPKENQANC